MTEQDDFKSLRGSPLTSNLTDEQVRSLVGISYCRMLENDETLIEEGKTDTATAVDAVREVGNPTILATFTIIAALLPMGWVSGLMGPYMRPIPINASAAMLFSLGVAFTISPWLAYRLFRKEAERDDNAGRPQRGRPRNNPRNDRGGNNRGRGNDARRRMKIAITARVLSMNQTMGGSSGPRQPVKACRPPRRSMRSLAMATARLA